MRCPKNAISTHPSRGSLLGGVNCIVFCRSKFLAHAIRRTPVEDPGLRPPGMAPETEFFRHFSHDFRKSPFRATSLEDSGLLPPGVCADCRRGPNLSDPSRGFWPAASRGGPREALGGGGREEAPKYGRVGSDWPPGKGPGRSRDAEGCRRVRILDRGRSKWPFGRGPGLPREAGGGRRGRILERGRSD